MYTDNIKATPNNVSYRGVDKFPNKILVWIAISEFGISAPVDRLSKSESIDQHFYLRKCLKKKLLPFIKNNIENKI